MQVKNTSWHFKVATEHGGLRHQNGFKYPSLCRYVWSVLDGIFMLILEFFFTWILPVLFDILIFSITYAIITGMFDSVLTCIFSFGIFCYLVIVVAYYKDYESYIGPLCILQRFTEFKFLKIIIEKICQPVKIVYVKEEN